MQISISYLEFSSEEKRRRLTPQLKLPQRSRSAGCKTTSLDTIQSYSETLPAYNKLDEASHHRLYEIWPGKNRFCCFGRCLLARSSDCKYVLITWGIILVFTLLYFIMIVHTLTGAILIFIPIFSGTLFVLTVIFYLLTSLSDPGIIPRKELFELFGKVPVQFTSRFVEQYAKQGEHPTTEQLNKLREAFKYCYVCKIYHSPRTSHCPYCDNCIEVFDHHCSFVGNCVGRRNYKFFVLFLACLVLYGLSMIAGFIFATVAKNEDYKFFQSRLVLVIMVVILGAALTVPLFFAVALFIYHLYLLCK
jgi:hypothetical protein